MILDASDYAHKKAKGNFRIVSLVPSLTELLFDLGLKESVVGRTPFCIHPKEEVDQVKRVGGTKTVNIEKILSEQPTHIVLNMDENKLELFEALKEEDVEIIVTHPDKPEDNLDLFDLFGYIFSRETEANQIANNFKKKLDKLAKNADKFEMRKVLYLIWRDPWMSVSEDTYISKMLKLIGWQTMPIINEKRYPVFTPKELAQLDYELCLLSSEPYPFKEKHVTEINSIKPSLSDVLLVDGEKLSWYGSRSLKGIDYLYELSRKKVGLEI